MTFNNNVRFTCCTWTLRGKVDEWRDGTTVCRACEIQVLWAMGIIA